MFAKRCSNTTLTEEATTRFATFKADPDDPVFLGWAKRGKDGHVLASIGTPFIVRMLLALAVCWRSYLRG